MAGYADSSARSSDRTGRTALPQTSRLLAPTRSSLAKSKPSDSPRAPGGGTEKGRRQSDVSDHSPGTNRDAQRDARGRRSSYPEEGGRDGKSGSPGPKSKPAGGSASTGRGRTGDSRATQSGSGRQDRSHGDDSLDNSSNGTHERQGLSPEKGLRGLKPVNTGNRPQGRTTSSSLADSGKLSGGERTPTAVKREVQSKYGAGGIPTSPRGSPRAMPTSPRARAEAYPTSPRSVGVRADSGKESSRVSQARKEKGAVPRSTLNPAQRGAASSEAMQGNEGMRFSGSWQQGLEGLYGEGDLWAEEALHRSTDRGFFQTAEFESHLGPDVSGVSQQLYEAEPQGWPTGVISKETLMQKKASAPLASEYHTAADTSTSERSSNLEDDDDGHKTGTKRGSKAEEGSPVSVLDVGATEQHSSKAQDTLRKVALGQATVQVGPWQGDSLVDPLSALPAGSHESGFNSAAAAVAAAIGSPLPSYLLDVASLDFMGDISGMEQDLEYVRHVLLLSGFAGKALPPVYSESNPIHPGVFEQLEQGITTGSVEGAHDAIIIDKARQAEERRQRRLLFDAVNEALGRRLMQYYARPIWVRPSQPVIRKLPLGKNLLKEVWEEIHDWPIASSDEVYDILDDAARRDMSRGTERWVEMGQERAECVFDLEKEILGSLLEEVAAEFFHVETLKRERRLQLRRTLKPRREVHIGR